MAREPCQQNIDSIKSIIECDYRSFRIYGEYLRTAFYEMFEHVTLSDSILDSIARRFEEFIELQNRINFVLVRCLQILPIYGKTINCVVLDKRWVLDAERIC